MTLTFLMLDETMGDSGGGRGGGQSSCTPLPQYRRGSKLSGKNSTDISQMTFLYCVTMIAIDIAIENASDLFKMALTQKYLCFQREEEATLLEKYEFT
jgi:hypothetical protein